MYKVKRSDRLTRLDKCAVIYRFKIIVAHGCNV